MEETVTMGPSDKPSHKGLVRNVIQIHIKVIFKHGSVNMLTISERLRASVGLLDDVYWLLVG